jgi:uncharacterized protein YjgD (DUF1641 family)
MAEEKKVKPLEMLDEKSMEAILSLAEAAAKLKESGLLDMLVTMAEKYEELLLYTSSDHRVYHALSLLEATLTGLKNVDPWKAKPALEMLTSCIANALSPETIEKAEPVKGVLSLMRALRDPYVAKGLGILIALAAAIGKCATETGKQKQ